MLNLPVYLSLNFRSLQVSVYQAKSWKSESCQERGSGTVTPLLTQPKLEHTDGKKGRAGCWLQWCAMNWREWSSATAWNVSEWIRDAGQRWPQSVALADSSRAKVQRNGPRRCREAVGTTGWPVTAGPDGDGLAALPQTRWVHLLRTEARSYQRLCSPLKKGGQQAL